MDDLIRVSSGLAARAATVEDSYHVFELIAACERDLDGRAEVDHDDIVADLGRPAMDLERDTVLVHDADELVGWAQIFKGTRAEADVRPTHRGRGIGTALLGWTEARAREAGSELVGQTVTDSNATAADLFGGHGYETKDTAWILEIAMREEPEVPDLPEGIGIRAFEPGRDDRDVYRMIDDAFNEWPGRMPSPFEEWAPITIGRETFDPSLSPLAVDGARVVGAVLSLDFGDELEGYVHQVAVHRDYRNRGIARALLRFAFRGFYRKGRRVCTLSTNSYTGALSLYERVGMRVRRSYTRYERKL